MKSCLVLLIAVVSLFSSGCVSHMSKEKHELDDMVTEVLERVSADLPNLTERLDRAEGYLVIDKRVVKYPFFGSGAGLGVAVDGATSEKVYLRLRRIETGGGWGARDFKALLIIQDRALLERIMSGTWMYEIGTEMSAGSSSVEGTGANLSPDAKYSIIVLPERGASVTWTLRAIRLTPYD